MVITNRKDLPPPHPKKLKLLTTCAVLFGNITFGCAFNFYSPSLEEMRSKYDTTVDEISIVFTIMLTCFCSGALTSGFIFNYMNRQLGSIICLAGISFAIIMTPHCPTLTLFFVNGGFLGFFIGCYDTVQVVWMIEIWQSKSGPYIQAQNFCYALGSNIPPLLLGPFLSNKHVDVLPTQDHAQSQDAFNTSTLNSNTTNATSDLDDIDRESHIYIPFAIAGFLNAIAMASQIFLFTFYRYYKPPLEEDLADVSDDNHSEKIALTGSNFSLSHHQHRLSIIKSTYETPPSVKAGINWPKVRLIIFAAIFLGAYCGMEVSTLQFIPTFGQYSDLKLSESDSAFVLTGITATFAIGRALGICIVMKVPPIIMLTGNLTLVLLGNLILLLGANSNLAMLWTGCIVLGAGFSTIYASFCAFIERHLLFTNSIGSFMVVTGSVFASIYPLVVGGFVAQNALVLTYTNFFSITLCILALGTAYKLTYKNTGRVG